MVWGWAFSYRGRYYRNWNRKKERKLFLPFWQLKDWTIGPGLKSQRKRMDLMLDRDVKSFPLRMRHGKRTVANPKVFWQMRRAVIQRYFGECGGP